MIFSSECQTKNWQILTQRQMWNKFGTIEYLIDFIDEKWQDKEIPIHEHSLLLPFIFKYNTNILFGDFPSIKDL